MIYFRIATAKVTVKILHPWKVIFNTKKNNKYRIVGRVYTKFIAILLSYQNFPRIFFQKKDCAIFLFLSLPVQHMSRDYLSLRPLRALLYRLNSPGPFHFIIQNLRDRMHHHLSALPTAPSTKLKKAQSRPTFP